VTQLSADFSRISVVHEAVSMPGSQPVVGHLPGLRCATWISCTVRSFSSSNRKSWIVTHHTRMRTTHAGVCMSADGGNCMHALTSIITDCSKAAIHCTSSMRFNILQKNSDKTEVLSCASATIYRKHQLAVSPLLINACSITPVPFARDLGVYIVVCG